MTKSKIPILPFALVTSLFFMWGLANNMTDTLLAAFKKIMSMSDFQTSFIQLAFYGAYFCLALPAAIFIWKFSYKAGILLGLGMFISGSLLFYPASHTMAYGHFLGALYILAGGLSILETTANPYIIAMGPEETGTWRLNFAQSFNPIGSITGVLLSKYFILSKLNIAGAEERAGMNMEQLNEIKASELSAVMGPYVGVAFVLLLLWIIMASIKMPKTPEIKQDLKQSLKRLLKNKQYMLGVGAQFFYVGAQIGVWSFTIRYVMQELQINEESAASYYLAALIIFVSARWIFTGLMKFIRPGKLLMISALFAIFSTLITIYASNKTGVIALVLISGFMSLMFPTIFGTSVRGLGNDTKIAGSGHIMAILGGAVITAIQGQVSDITGSIKLAYFVPMICFIIIAFYGRLISKSTS